MDQRKKVSYFREFLNLPYLTSTSSCISYNIVLVYWGRIKGTGLYNAATINFSISDCSKNINLEFDISSKEEMSNSLYKLDVIINACTKMKEDLKVARKEILIGRAKLKEIENGVGK